MEEKTYSGWTNYATRAVKLWLDNDQGAYEYWREQARERHREAPESPRVKEGFWSKAEAELLNLADQLKTEIEEASPITEASMFSDLMNTALSEVNWIEIATSILDALPEEETDERDEEEAEEIKGEGENEAEQKEESRPEKTDETLTDNSKESPFGPVIYCYTRAQAIADGVLVDVSKTAQEAGIKYPTAMTSTVWGKYVEVPQAVSWQDEAGRLWDIIFLLSLAIRQSVGGSEIRFRVLVQNNRRGPKPVELKAVCGPGDDAEPVITVMLPEED
jgi:hypothetical protein